MIILNKFTMGLNDHVEDIRNHLWEKAPVMNRACVSGGIVEAVGIILYVSEKETSEQNKRSKRYILRNMH